MALRASKSSSANSLLSKFRTAANQSAAFEIANTIDQYNQGLISPQEVLATLETRRKNLTSNTSAALSLDKQIANIRKDIEELPLANAVKNGSMITLSNGERVVATPGMYADWLEENKLSGLDPSSARYMDITSQINNLKISQVNLEKQFVEDEASDLKYSDPAAADKMLLNFYRERAGRAPDPVTAAKWNNDFILMQQQVEKNSIGRDLKNQAYRISSMGTDTVGKAAASVKGLEQLYNEAMSNGLYDYAQSIATQLNNAQTSLANAIHNENQRAESAANKAETAHDQAVNQAYSAWKDFVDYTMLTKSPEQAQQELATAYINGFTWTSPTTGEKIQIPAGNIIYEEKINLAEKKGDADTPNIRGEVALFDRFSMQKDLGQMTTSELNGLMNNISDSKFKNNFLYAMGVSDRVYVGRHKEPIIQVVDGQPQIVGEKMVEDYTSPEDGASPSKGYVNVNDNTMIKMQEIKKVIDPATGEEIEVKGNNEKLEWKDEEGKDQSAVPKIGEYNGQWYVQDPSDPNKVIPFDIKTQNPVDILRKSKIGGLSDQEIQAMGGQKISDGYYSIPQLQGGTDYIKTGFGFVKASDIVKENPGVQNPFMDKLRKEVVAEVVPSVNKAVENMPKVENPSIQNAAPAMAQAQEKLTAKPTPPPASQPVNFQPQAAKPAVETKKYGSQPISNTVANPVAAAMNGGLGTPKGIPNTAVKVADKNGTTYWRNTKGPNSYDYYKAGFGGISVDDMSRETGVSKQLLLSETAKF